MGYEKTKVALKVLTLSTSFLFSLTLIANPILNDNYSTISGFLGQSNYITIEEEGDGEVDTIYHPTEYKSIAEQKANSKRLCEAVVGEGAVLLKNDNNALPIKTSADNKAKVSLFSASSIDLAVTGGGSGANNTKDKLDLKTTFEAENFELNLDLWNWYTANKATYGRQSTSSIGVEYSINDADWTELPDAKNQAADVAVFVLSRFGSESVDSRMNTGDPTDMTNGNYLELSPSEISVIENISKNTGEGKTFKKFVILMNTTNQVECDFLEKYNIDACLWTGSLGSMGASAVAKIISGTINPSGRLSDAFWKEHRFNPVYANWGLSYYDLGNGTDSSTITQANMSSSSSPYVVYQEGIYNGYYYAETRYEDKLFNKANVDDAGYRFNYYEAISYPFGYGLSYTTFDYSDFKLASYDTLKDVYNFSIKVTNTGEVAGKDAVQLYLQKPYTQYDIDNKVEKSAIELVAFNKTDILNPGESEVVEISVEGKYMASYDSYNAKTYILDKGDYYFAFGRDSHDAVNNVIKAKNSSVATEAQGRTTTGSSDFTYKVEVAEFDAEKYSTSVTGAKITNKFDNADLKLYSPENKDRFEYITRNNWVGTAKLGLDENMKSLGNNVKLVWTDLIEKETRDMPNEGDKVMLPEKTDVAYPTYGSTATNWSLIDLRVDENGDMIPFEDERWQQLLDQLTFEEQSEFLACGVRMTRGIASINKPTTIDHNGGAGVNQVYNGNSAFNRGFAVMYDDPDKGTSPCAYPANTVAASTFNLKLMEEYGLAWGEDALWAGYSGLYGPGNNGHRGAYGGRTFEYYSEDPILGGRICAMIVKGLVSKGIYTYLKHAILNEQEEYRLQIGTWVNEQTIREIYLRQTELAIVEGGAQCVMTGYNRIGALWTGRQGFVNTVLHEEFGMTGFAVTDFLETGYEMRLPLSVLEGNGLIDRDFSYASPYQYCSPKIGGYGHVAQAMRLEVHRILYTVVHSAAMNGISSNMKMIPVTPAWEVIFNCASACVTTLFVGSGLLLVWTYVYDLFLKDKFESEEGGN